MHCTHRKQEVPDDGVGQLKTLQAQVLQEAAVTQDALQSSSGDDGVGQIHLQQLQRAAITLWKDKMFQVNGWN